MEDVRRKNEPFITKLDEDITEKQRDSQRKHRLSLRSTTDEVDKDSAGQSRLKAIKLADGETVPEDVPSDIDRKKYGRNGPGTGGDPYHTGNYSFATPIDLQKGLALHCSTPDEIVVRAEEGKIDWALCKDIKICWNPGKRGETQKLEQAVFRIYDSLITRQQLTQRPVLTKRAAECIVDFCPDLLWREMLLRMCSEAGFGNKDVRHRFCINGCHADKATFTKRIAAALGQKQTGPSIRARSSGEGSAAKKGQKMRSAEDRWYDENSEDFENYIQFFGKRTSHRGLPRTHHGRKRRFDSEGLEDGSMSVKRSKSVASGTVTDASSPAKSDGTGLEVEADADAGAEEKAEEEEEYDSDAVSVQDSDILDAMDDD